MKTNSEEATSVEPQNGGSSRNRYVWIALLGTLVIVIVVAVSVGVTVAGSEDRSNVKSEITALDDPFTGTGEGSLSLSSFPSQVPSTKTNSPTLQLSAITVDTDQPSKKPSLRPSVTTTPSTFPSTFPSSFPSNIPSLRPSTVPSSVPSTSAAPSITLSTVPSIFPSTAPSTFPSTPPSSFPSTVLSTLPSTPPSLSPSILPSTSPSPSANPSTAPLPVSSTVPSTVPSESAPARTCNGVEGLCDLRVNEIMYAALHNANADSTNGYTIFNTNHFSPLEEALGAGYRAINVDVARCSGIPTLVHGPCFAGRRNAVQVFGNLQQFLVDNPTEVVVLELQLDGVLPTDILTVIEAVPGMLDSLYVHTAGDEWPTLQTLTDQGTRLIVFHFSGPSCAETTCPPGLHFWFDYGVNTQYDFGSINALLDTQASCSLTSAGRASTRDWFRVNNYVTLANPIAAGTVNSVEFAEERAAACSTQNNLPVNLLAVDFWTRGSIVELVQNYNEGLVVQKQQQ